MSFNLDPTKQAQEVHGVKVGPGLWDLGILRPETQDLPQSLKVGPGTP